MSHAAYAGTFDPMTFGHVDVAERAAQVFDRLTLAVSAVSRKNVLFSVEERMALARTSVAHLKNVEVVPFSGLLVEWARNQGIYTLIRGLRAFSDFEYEFQMALTNRNLAPDVETMFLMPNEEYSYVSSSLVKEIAALGGEVEKFVPPEVAVALWKKLGT
ncbi:MAG: pantetheine-phosphate adenylyltransferase [Verrucomicrobiota bacterium]|jgi:pantetheine-phosphate adenylyltransferase|nr:pantetheine-phosphate adenylyltransferase [Verrucomicrobiota bacterium]